MTLLILKFSYFIGAQKLNSFIKQERDNDPLKCHDSIPNAFISATQIHQQNDGNNTSLMTLTTKQNTNNHRL